MMNRADQNWPDGEQHTIEASHVTACCLCFDDEVVARAIDCACKCHLAEPIDEMERRTR